MIKVYKLYFWNERVHKKKASHSGRGGARMRDGEGFLAAEGIDALSHPLMRELSQGESLYIIHVCTEQFYIKVENLSLTLKDFLKIIKSFSSSEQNS